MADFTAGQGYSADADYSPTSWLIHRTGVTKGAARGHRAWARRALTHPLVVAALAEGTVLTESVATLICRRIARDGGTTMSAWMFTFMGLALLPFQLTAAALGLRVAGALR